LSIEIVKRAAVRSGFILGAWSVVALLVSAQIEMAARIAGHPQPWAQTLAGSLSWCGAWALLTPATIWLGRRFDVLGGPGRIKILGVHAVAGLLTVTVHAILFALVAGWLVHSRPFIPNTIHLLAVKLSGSLHFNLMVYVLIVGVVSLADGYVALRDRAIADGRLKAQLAQAETALGQAVKHLHEAPSPVSRLIARTHGRAQSIRPDEIDWLGAAGDYVEAHMGERTVLLDGSLTALLDKLPAGRFARVHRTTVVRLDRIVEIAGIGHGDALLTLHGGTRLKLSRRYRANLAGWFKGDPPGGD